MICGTKMSLSLGIFLLIVNVCNGYLKFATYYQDHMVLQRGPQSAIVWGASGVNSGTVTVEVKGPHNLVYTAKSEPSTQKNVWKVKLPPITDHGPFTITASDTVGGKITINDVLFGDVWLCSGQSNMYFPISWLFNPQKTIDDAIKFDNIRFFKSVRVTSTPANQMLHKPDIPWSKPTNGTLPEFSALCWLYAQYLYPHRNYPFGMVEAAWGGTTIEVWSSPEVLAKCPAGNKRAIPTQESVLWNSMIQPFTSMTIYGTIWYQGEANGRHAERYSCEFPAMIADWRNKFHHASMGQTDANFPFGFVQLAPNQNSSVVGGTPYLRLAQTANVGHVPNPKMPKTFMAVAMDLPDYNAPNRPIHPRYKEDVAHRLVLSARAVAYGEIWVDYQGPFPSGFKLDPQTHQLTVEYLWQKNITLRTNDGFEICCSWRNTTNCMEHDHWEAVPVMHHTSSSVTIPTTICDRRHFVGLRYEWHTSPCSLRKCAVYGADSDLPAPPFIRATAFPDSSTQIIG